MSFPTHPAPTTLPMPVTPQYASPIAVGIPLEFMAREALDLARYVVAELDEPIQLARAMGLDDAQWLVLNQSTQWKQLLLKAQAEANGPQGLADRLRLKAMMAIDNGGVIDMASIMANPGAPVNARIAAFNALNDLSGLAKQKDQQAAQTGSGPLVNIIMPKRDGAPVQIQTAVTVEQT